MCRSFALSSHALSLLTRMSLLSPAPFFVMDEIDAALDNVNVNKVSTYIQQQSSDLQFVVISLKDIFYEKVNGVVETQKQLLQLLHV
jgi:structural maintenance of chromosome 1